MCVCVCVGNRENSFPTHCVNLLEEKSDFLTQLREKGDATISQESAASRV